MKGRGKDLRRLKEVVEFLSYGYRLPENYRDHKLKGKFSNSRDCHLEPDWILIYTVDKDKNLLILERTGSHSDLFR